MEVHQARVSLKEILLRCSGFMKIRDFLRIAGAKAQSQQTGRYSVNESVWNTLSQIKVLSPQVVRLSCRKILKP